MRGQECTWRAGRALAILLLAALAGCTGRAPSPAPELADGRRIDAALLLSPEGPDDPDARFDLPTGPWRLARVTLRSTTYREIPASVTCDGPAHLSRGEGSAFLRPGGRQGVTVPARGQPPARLDLTEAVTTCRVSWGEGHQVTLQRPELTRPEVARLDRARNACVMPPPGTLDPLAQAFYASTGLSRTCAIPSGAIDLVHGPLDALSARLQALTGTTVRCMALDRRDADVPLDFSKAPKLDLIVLASLHIRADFCGAVMRQAMTYHAARGTPVRILVSHPLQTGKDREYWDDFAARYPNVQIQYYRWTPRGPATPASEFDALHRVSHVKLLLALSPEPGRSRIVMGGRNLHDGFFFQDPVPLPGHPELRHFDAEGRDGLAWFATFEDIDLVIRDDGAVRQVAAHFGKLWRRDTPGHVGRAAAQAGRVGAVPADGVMRHFISLPFSDGRALERDYVGMIDAARREITIVTPFLYPPASIDAALVRARARGVRVRLISRLESSEPSAPVTRALAAAYINRRYRAFEIYDYVPAPRMVHSKILVIDGRLAMSSSVNLNARSFLQDTENGLVFLDRAMAARLSAVVEGFRSRARRIDAPISLPPLARAVGAVPALWQYF